MKNLFSKSGRFQRSAASVILVLLASLAFILLKHPSHDVDLTSQGSSSPNATQPTILLGVPKNSDSLIGQLPESGALKLQTEDFNQVATALLHRLEDFVLNWSDIEDERLQSIIDASFRCPSLAGTNPRSVFEGESIQVIRARPVTLDDVSEPTAGVARFRSAINAWLGFGHNRPASRLRLDTKVSNVQLAADGSTATTRIHATFTVIDGNHRRQHNATWRCSWAGVETTTPKISSIEVEALETISVAGSDKPLFQDCTDSVLAGNETFREQFNRGASFWCERLVARMGVYLRSLHGVAVADINGDGLDDLYICEPGGLPNRLYVQNADGTARDISVESGVDLLEPTRSALILDFDNDGKQDLALSTIYSAITIFRGDGQGHFTLGQVIPVSGKAYGLASADYDSDGLLDLFVCVYNDVAGEIGESGGGIPEPYYDANQGAANILLRNVGNLSFREVTSEVGMNVNNRRFSYAAAWEDFDNDGDQDLYVANDFGRNNFYRNDDGQFVDIARKSETEDIASGMAVAWDDYDNDGRMDLHVSNMWSSAGMRITGQQQFPAKNPSTRSLFQRLARGNSLFRNNHPDHRFQDVSDRAGITLGRWAWGCKFIDINNDSHRDLVVANGFVSGKTTDDL